MVDCIVTSLSGESLHWRASSLSAVKLICSVGLNTLCSTFIWKSKFSSCWQVGAGSSQFLMCAATQMSFCWVVPTAASVHLTNIIGFGDRPHGRTTNSQAIPWKANRTYVWLEPGNNSASSHLPAAVFSSSSSSLSEARKGTVARSSSSALMRPTMPSPWILQSIPELRHCLIAISMYLWYCWGCLYKVITTLELRGKTKTIRSCQLLKQTNLSAVTKEEDSGVSGIDVNCLEFN